MFQKNGRQIERIVTEVHVPLYAPVFMQMLLETLGDIYQRNHMTLELGGGQYSRYHRIHQRRPSVSTGRTGPRGAHAVKASAPDYLHERGLSSPYFLVCLGVW